MDGGRVRHVLCESERFERTHATRKEGLPVIAEDDNVGQGLVEGKETAQKFGTLAGIETGLRSSRPQYRWMRFASMPKRASALTS